MTVNKWCRKTKISYKSVSYIFCILTPFLLSPLAASSDEATRCGYVALLMSVFWMFEPVHLAVTALLPIVLLPLFGILSSDIVCDNYMKDVLMMYVGGLAVATAVEQSKLHERIALRVLLLLGSNTKWLMLGFMLTTMFLSMWISNTATTAMMVPIVDAVMAELNKGIDIHTEGAAEKNNILHRSLLLSVAYSANCGGTGTVTGTSPNMIFKGMLEKLYPKSTEITYATWMMYNVPGMILCVTLAWLVLQVIYVPCWKKEDEGRSQAIHSVIKRRYDYLGSITFHEIAVLILFIILVFLWIFREPQFMPGWASAITTQVRIGNSVPVIAILFLLFLIPAEPWRWQSSPPLLQWHVMQLKLPWGLVLLMGGGYALADGMQSSGLSNWLGKQMVGMSVLPAGAVLVILCVLTAALTEVISNSTVTTILLPVVSRMAVAFQVHPLYLMLPVTISSSYAFMLPVATGPNAIVAESGRMSNIHMVKPGIVMNVIACMIQVLMINTLGVALFNLHEFPSWVNQTHTSTLIENRTSHAAAT